MITSDPLFWAKVNKTEMCWLWTGAHTKFGHGVLRRWNSGKPRNYVAHRYVLGMLDSVDYSKVVDHICRVPNCVRPSHLRIVTNKQNRENLRGANSNSTTGIRGVSWSNERQKFVASLRHNYRTYGKRFDTLEEAEAWVIRKRIELFTHNDLDRVA